MAYLGQTAHETEFTNRVTDTMSGDGSDTTLTLSTAPISVNNVIVFIDGVMQRPTTDFTVSGTTLTFAVAPHNSANVQAITGGGEHIGIPLAPITEDQLVDGVVTSAKLESGIQIPASKITSLAASKITGALPALDGSALTGMSPLGVGIDNVTVNPSPTTNPSGGVGTIHLNKTTGEMFVCTNATADNNIWFNVGEGSGDISNELPTNPTSTNNFPDLGQAASVTYTFSGATDADGSVTHYLVDQISDASLTVPTAEVAAGSAHTFTTSAVGSDVPVTFRVRAKDNDGAYSAGVTVSTTIISWSAPSNMTADHVFSTHDMRDTDITGLPSQAVVMFRSVNNSYVPHVQLLNISGTSISNSGASVGLSGSSCQHIRTAKLSDSKVVLVYNKGSGKPVARVATVGASAISTHVESGQGPSGSNMSDPDVVALNENLIVVAGRDNASGDIGKMFAGSISNDQITWGAIHTPNGNNHTLMSLCRLTDTTGLVTYDNQADSGRQYVKFFSVSGNTISSSGSQIQVSDNYGGWANKQIIGLTETKAIMVYKDGGNNGCGKAIIINCTGGIIDPNLDPSDAITFGQYNGSPATISEIVAEKLNSTSVVVFYKELHAGDRGRMMVLEISGNTITTNSPHYPFTGGVLGGSYSTDVTALDPTNAMITYRNPSNNQGITKLFYS